MISAPFSDNTLRALLDLETMAEPFTVCGSRFFGDSKPNSDFDFVTENSGIEPVLANLGFQHSEADAAGYLDLNTSAIFEMGKVHVIVSKNLALRLEAREYIQAHGLNRHETAVWDAFYESRGLK